MAQESHEVYLIVFPLLWSRQQSIVQTEVSHQVAGLLCVEDCELLFEM